MLGGTIADYSDYLVLLFIAIEKLTIKCFAIPLDLFFLIDKLCYKPVWIVLNV